MGINTAGNASALFHKAERRRSFIKLAITGPSGSGKTYSALLLAQGLGGGVAMIDTESGSGEMYSSLCDYDAMQIDAPFTVQKYIAGIKAAAATGYNVVIIDSLSHAWAGEGGLLSQKESLDARGGNKFANWALISKAHEQFKATLLQTPIHIIATMRSKQDYVLPEEGPGKGKPIKVGMAPIQRDGMEYEFTTVFDIAMNHEAAVSKDRTGLFDGITGKLTIEHGQQIKAWLEGATAEPTTVPVQTASNGDARPAPQQQPLSRQQQPQPIGQSQQPPPQQQRQQPPVLPLGQSITVIISKGQVRDTRNGPAYVWPAAWEDDNEQQHSAVLWCWHQRQPMEATAMSDPENFHGYVTVQLSRVADMPAEHYRVDAMGIGVGPVLNMDKDAVGTG